MKKSLCIIFLFIGISLSAQDISLKTNLLYDISTTPPYPPEKHIR